MSRNTSTVACKNQVYEDLRAGMGQSEVAKKYSISQGTVSKIKRKSQDGTLAKMKKKAEA